MTAHQHFALTSAFLCCNCDAVGDRRERCACCGSEALLSLGAILNREAVGAYEQEKALWVIERQLAR